MKMIQDYRLKQFGRVFEYLNEQVYIVDMDTYELIYMNVEAKAAHAEDDRDFTGKKCYEVVRGCQAPCSICPFEHLEEEKYYESVTYEPRENKRYVNRSTKLTLEGKGYCIQFTRQMDQSFFREKRDYRQIDTMVHEGVRQALEKDYAEDSLNVILEYMGKSLQVDRVYIFEKNKWGNDDNTYEWCAAGITAEKDSLQNVPAEVCADWYKNFEEGGVTKIRDIEDIRETMPMQYEYFSRQNIRSLVTVPLYNEKKCIGFFGVDNPLAEDLRDTSYMLQFAGYFITSMLRQRDLQKQLAVMSYRDQLTGLGNRHMLEEMIRDLKEEPAAVIYCDLTGLKTVNDQKGHKAGDELLKKTAQVIFQIFEGPNLFRIGGDEFLLVGIGVDRPHMEEKVESMRRKMKENEINIAVGTAWAEDGSRNFERLMAQAEQVMYADKAAYYKSHGLERRRQMS